METAPDLEKAASAYGHVVATFDVGMFRFRSAEAAHARLLAALLSYRSLEGPVRQLPEPYQEVFTQLEKIPRSSYDALRYVTDLSLLVYATTLLDTFLLETTTFLLLLFPRSLGKTQQIPVSSLVSASSTSQLVSEAVSRKARELSFLPFVARVEYLRETFGLKYTLHDGDQTALAHFSSIRNAAVHDQGIYELALSDDGTIVCHTRRSAVRPTDISEHEVEAAVGSYRRVAGVIATAVMGQCLKAPNHPSLELLRAHLESAPSSPMDSHLTRDVP